MELQLRDKAWQEKEAAKYQEDEEYYVQEKMIVREENETPETWELEEKKAWLEFYAKTLCGMQTFTESPLPSIQPTPLNSAKSGAKSSSRDGEKEKIN